jgi:hypothetical protein
VSATTEEHKKRVEEMQAAEKRVREWLADPAATMIWSNSAIARDGAADVALLLERIDGYENSITWHTDCLQCPKLYDQIYKMDQHTIPALREALREAAEFSRVISKMLGRLPLSAQLKWKDFADALARAKIKP